MVEVGRVGFGRRRGESGLEAGPGETAFVERVIAVPGGVAKTPRVTLTLSEEPFSQAHQGGVSRASQTPAARGHSTGQDEAGPGDLRNQPVRGHHLCEQQQQPAINEKPPAPAG
jgi:hypothetical protein